MPMPSAVVRFACVALSAFLVGVAVAQPTVINTMSFVADLRIHPFSEMPLPNYYVADGATVAIEYGFNPGYDKLLLDYQGSFPITSSFSDQNGILYLSGVAPLSEYSAAIQSVVFVTSATDGNNRQITFTYGQNTTFASSTQHFYKYVVGPTLPWSQAQQDCAGRTYMGMQGYLATITSTREMTEVAGRAASTSWVGAAPNGSNVWTWVTGPEGLESGGSGRAFWVGEDLYNGGYASNWLAFNAWAEFMPTGSAANGTYVVVTAPQYESVAFLSAAGPSDGVQSWICEFGGLDSAAVAATASQYTSSITLVFDCSLFTSSADCQNHASQGCGWSSGSCSKIDCSKYLLQSTCVSDWRCDWFTNGETGICANTECSAYANQASCVTDPSCYFSNQHCLQASCRNMGTSCTCAAMSGCTWTGGKCLADSSVGCSLMDVVYVIDGTVNMSQQFERYPNGFVGVTQTLIASDLSLTGTSAATAATSSDIGSRVGVVVFGGNPVVAPAGIGSGGRLTGLHSELKRDVQYLQQAYTASVTTRKIGAALLTAQAMFSTGTDRKRIVVIVTSAAITDASTAAATAASLQSSGIALVGVVLQTTEPQTPDSVAAAATLRTLLGGGVAASQLVSTTMTNYFTQVVYGLCSNTPLTAGAFFPKTLSICSSRTTWSACMADSRCQWDNAGKTCSSTACLKYCTSASCNADPSCAYSGTQCGQKCAMATYAASQAACSVASIACTWSNNSCVPLPCIANPTEDSCIADKYGCVFTNGKCQVPQCTAGNIASCIQSPAANGVCAFSPTGTCFFSPCQTTNATRCSTFPQCQWVSGKCSLNPCGQQFQTEASCSAQRNCVWNTSVSPAVCGLAPCSGLNFLDNAKTACGANPACYWQPKSENGYQDLCILKPCYANQRSCDCAAQSGCVWTNNTCKDTTFVQCPAMDVVFLVEATPTMTHAFGRHPNGFTGIVEALRSWGNSVPMAPTPSQTGFRLAIVGYGSVNRALQPAEGDPIYGTNFTNNQTRWVAPNLILDNFEATQPAYATFAGDDVAIFQGLKAASSLFDTFGLPNRKQILMIFGHSAITDGDEPGVQEIIDHLALTGVQVFTNVVRRFSVITAGEQLAAQYMSPLASDPVETHYSFATIDDLQASVLESFCDPSTTIGGALGISEDGTLPCNWLSGKTQCNMQGSCHWNSTAVPTCPQAGQCPNMGCVALPPALAARFSCKHCSYSGGVFSCDRSNNYAAPAGVCLTTPCAANCGSAACGAVVGGLCTWEAQSGRCQRAMCGATTPADCNRDLGCTWVGGVGGACRLSQCWSARSSTTCDGFTTDGINNPCSWNTTLTPAVCVEDRCPLLDQTVCGQFPAQCDYSGLGGCVERLCQYTDAELCNSDAGCYWNPYQRIAGQFGTCNARQKSCVVTPSFSAWSECTANCGAGAVRYASRAIVQFPSGGGRSCADVASSLSPPGLAISQQCNATTIAGWTNDCNAYCSQFSTSVSQCIFDSSCQWKNLQCQPRTVSGCAALTTSATCSASDMCTWDPELQFCRDDPQACQFSAQSQCTQAPQCMWRTGMNSNLLAASLTLDGYLVNPGQLPIHPFPTLVISSNDIHYGASVVIENGYQVGKDVLQMTNPTSLTVTWIPQSGTLRFSGAASSSEFGYAIRAVTFHTSALSAGSRNITWSLGNATLYSVNSGHWYRYVPFMGATWDFASQACSADSFFGYGGYLATITSAAENSLVATKLGGDGWMSGDNAQKGQWMLDSGPESGKVFWIGGSVISGGYAASNAYANWDILHGEPRSTGAQMAHAYLNQSGYWMAKVSNDPRANGYVCEYGGTANDQPTTMYPVGGAVVIGIAGCLPTTPCIYHVSSAQCMADSQCTWVAGANNSGTCIVGCGTFSTVGECNSGSNCIWDTTVLPPQCSPNTCTSILARTSCVAAAQCTWLPSGCAMKTGCAQYLSAGSCNTIPTCLWSGTPASCSSRPCQNLGTQASCTANPLCQWQATIGCTTIVCRYGSAAECQADRQCKWESPDGTSVSFSAGGQKIAPFRGVTLTPPNNMNLLTDGVTVMITLGFQKGNDVLTVDQSDNIGGSWIISYNPLTGVLSLKAAPGVQLRAVTALQQMQSMVKFYSSSPTLIRRTITYTLALNAYYSASTNTFYRLLPSVTNSYATATTRCMQSTLFGVPGVVAAVTSQQDNLALRSIGASGFLGITFDKTVWDWNYNGTLAFWQGSGSLGAQMNGLFSAWSSGEPQGANSFGVMNPSGTWKSIPSNGVVNYGIICQYTPPVGVSGVPTVVSGSVNAKPTGCFASPCIGFPQTSCMADPTCVWVPLGNNSYCMADTFCTVATSVAACAIRQLCYWDYVYGSCRTQPSTVCSSLSQTTCSLFSQCAWQSAATMLPRNASASGFCRYTGCASYPNQDSCSAVPSCVWSQQAASAIGQCAARVCGYTSATLCWSDPTCQWDYQASQCARSSCATLSAASCTGSCAISNGQCAFKRCSATTLLSCISDSACLFSSTTGCFMTSCTSVSSSTACKANTQCYWNEASNPSQCVASACLSYDSELLCATQFKTCQWMPNAVGVYYCKELSFYQQYAASSPGTCPSITSKLPWWIWILFVVDFVLLIGILYRIYLAFSTGLTFFEPLRRSKKYDYTQYASDLFTDAQDYALDNNGVNYGRPSLNDL